MELRIVKVIALIALWMGMAVGLHAQTVVEYIHTDALGTPVAVTDATGTVIERSVYEPYGQLISRPLTDGPGFTGHVQDAATGLTYMQQRYYDPEVGRFLSVDPVGVSPKNGLNFNRYWYASNNPYKNTDPDGRCDGPSTCAIDRDIAAMNHGEMSRQEFMDRSAARGAGAVAGLLLVAGGVALAPEAAFVGTSAQEITAINTGFGGLTALTGNAETVVVNMSYRTGFFDKAAVAIRDIAGRHLFNDANKRTATALVQRLAGRNDIRIAAQRIRTVVDQVAKGKLKTVEEIAKALRAK